jgi:hypothetical protein
VNNIGSATNKTVLDLFNKMRAKELILRTEFQRKLVWNDAHKESFIETILKRLPFPEVYLASGELDLERQTSTTLVVDGQQRLNTIYQYVSGDNKLLLKRTPLFAALEADGKTAFLDYQVVIRDLGRISEETLHEIFKRINSVQYALNAIEIANALYDGEFITTAKEIAESEAFTSLEVFTETENSRMRDVDFILLILTTLELKSYFTESKEVSEFIQRFDDNFPDKERLRSLIDAAFFAILNADLPADSLWFRKSGFFSLTVELCKYIEEKNVPQPEQLRATLNRLQEDIMKNRHLDDPENRYAQYYRYIYQQTTSRLARVTRGALLAEYLQKSS